MSLVGIVRRLWGNLCGFEIEVTDGGSVGLFVDIT